MVRVQQGGGGEHGPKCAVDRAEGAGGKLDQATKCHDLDRGANVDFREAKGVEVEAVEVGDGGLQRNQGPDGVDDAKKYSHSNEEEDSVKHLHWGMR